MVRSSVKKLFKKLYLVLSILIYHINQRINFVDASMSESKELMSDKVLRAIILHVSSIKTKIISYYYK